MSVPLSFSSTTATPVTYAAAPTTATYAAAPTTTYAAAPTTYAAAPAPASSINFGATTSVRAVTTTPVTTVSPTYPVASYRAGAAPLTIESHRVTEKDVAPWGGGCPWQYDKTEFKKWVKTATEIPSSKERKELYGYLSECFLDSDADRDGLVGMDEFDFMVEKAAAMPRRFGLAPSWVECYGDVPHREQARQQMFHQMDKHRRGKIGMEEWIEFTMQHITEKVKTLDFEAIDFAHLEKAGRDQFVTYLEQALANRHSEQYKAFYEFLFKVFVESDKDEKGAITIEQFDILIEDAAQAPRVLGLAPTTAQQYPTEAHKRAARASEFLAMDTDSSGTVTFDKFLNWGLAHVATKVQEYRSGGGFGQ